MKYKTKIKHNVLEALKHSMEVILDNPATLVETDDDKLLMCGLDEIRTLCAKKLVEFKTEYSISLSPVQAMSLKLFCMYYLSNHYTQLGNKLLQMSNEIDRQFN